MGKILRGLRPGHDLLGADSAFEADYLERDAEGMRYPSFRAQGPFAEAAPSRAAAEPGWASV